MQTSVQESAVKGIIPTVGEAIGGGFYAGRILIDETVYAIIVAPKAEGENEGIKWIGNYKDVPGAKSYFDGFANTNAMAEAGSELAQWVRSLSIGGFDDWYIPSQDELEIIYRNLKPTEEENSCYARSGINLSSFDPTYPYTPESPAMTTAEAFQEGGAEALADEWYWSSTQHAGNSGSAWSQGFDHGSQYGSNSKNDELRARAVRRLAL